MTESFGMQLDDDSLLVLFSRVRLAHRLKGPDRACGHGQCHKTKKASHAPQVNGYMRTLPGCAVLSPLVLAVKVLVGSLQILQAGSTWIMILAQT